MIINFLLLFQVLNLIAGFFKAEKAIDLLHFSKVSRNMYDYFFYEEKIPIFPLEIQISTEVAKGENLSRYFFEIIFAKTLNKDKYDEDELYKNSYILRFNLSKDKAKEDFLQIRKCLEENRECSKKEVGKAMKSKKSTDIHYNIFIETDNYGIKIFSKNTTIFEEKINFKSYFGEEFYIKVKSSKKGILFKNFSFKIPSDKTKKPRFLKEKNDDGGKEGGKFTYLEMDPLNIEAESNYLREGNIYVIPSVILNPKDEKGNFPSDIKDTSLFPKRKLFKLINATHSRDDPHFEYMAELVNDQLVFMFETQIPGELYLTSNYFKNNTFKIKIKNGEIVPESIEALRIKEEIMSDNYVRFKIIAKDKYGRLIFLEQSDLDKLEMNVKYPNNTIIKEDMQYISDIESKSVIINKILYMAGKTTFQFKYNDQSIICNDCSSYPKYNEFDFNNSKVEYNKEINLGENISLSLSPKDVYNNKLPAKEIINKLVIDCLINNKTIIKINSYLDEEKNIINITNGEIITQPGNLSLIISYNYKEIKFDVKVIEHMILDKTICQNKYINQ